ncbi:uncharacterized protein LTR77_001271 [Saxophila tyrrhenica]|uniref:Alpha/beta hydrolase fold-3 domain-containing protein n=1 Tax=Saxophila tyrrhenica TaxID=1690608 RepID=A0AAV9PN27_9PEZI|nr:hypothetical protein LTR77_001271 [Saxophila tyrrhenica]
MPGEARQLLKHAVEAAADEAKTGKSSHEAVKVGAYQAPGRIGDPGMGMEHDPRVNPKLLAAVRPLGMDKFQAPPGLAKLTENSSMEEIAELVDEFEQGIMMVYGGHAISLDLPSDKDMKVEMTEETIKGGDGQDMKVYVYRPSNQGDEKLPAVVYTHGGGMVLVATMNPVHDFWCKGLASQGLVVVMPDFRNAYTKEKYNHFPAGLNDCVAAVKWTSANKDRLKIRNIVLNGESGGGNLACAISLQANRDGWVKEISGVYPIVPYISNLYGASAERKLKELPSLVENHGYFLNSWSNAFLGYFYTPTDEGASDPIAWPYHATEDMMKGLPPHVVVMDQLDPLRDEGFSYAQRLAKTGVQVKYSMNIGVLHGSALLFRSALPELHLGMVREVAAFAKSL